MKRFFIVSENGDRIAELYLAEKGVSPEPWGAMVGENKELAARMHGWIRAEATGRVSFGKFRAEVDE